MYKLLYLCYNNSDRLFYQKGGKIMAKDKSKNKDKVTVKSKEEVRHSSEEFENAMEKIKEIRLELMGLNIALILLGLVMIVIPKEFNQFVTQIVGCILCVWGVLRGITFLRLKNEEMFGSYALVQGVAMLVFGVFLLFQAERFAALLNNVLTLIILVVAAVKLQNAINYFKLKVKNWWLHLIAAVLLLIFGIIALVKPGFVGDEQELLMIMTIIMGTALVISGIWDIVSVHILSKAVQKKVKEIDDAKRAKEQNTTEDT